MKADMLDSTTITLENAAGAVMTNCIFAAYAVGDITELEEAVTAQLHIKEVCEPRAEVHAFYQEQYDLKNHLVKEDMANAFKTLARIRK